MNLSFGTRTIPQAAYEDLRTDYMSRNQCEMDISVRKHGSPTGDESSVVRREMVAEWQTDEAAPDNSYRAWSEEDAETLMDELEESLIPGSEVEP